MPPKVVETKLTQSHNEITSENNEIYYKVILLLLATALNGIEFFLPRIPMFPWLKPGTANIITIVWLIRYGYREALLLSVLRIWIVSFYFGFSFITFSLAVSGSIFSCSVMYFLHKTLKYRLGMIGLALTGAVFHNMGQLLVVYFLMANNIHIFYQIPFMNVAAVISGVLVGVLASYLLKYSPPHYIGKKKLLSEKSPPLKRSQILLSSFLLLLCVSLVLISSHYVLTGIALLITAVAFIVTSFSFTQLFLPITRFWAFFLFIGIFHLFLSYGKIVPSIPIMTYEGIDKTITQWLRLWTWLQTTALFIHLQFHTSIITLLSRYLPRYRNTLTAALLTTEYFPDVINLVKQQYRTYLKRLFTSPSQIPSQLISEISELIANKE